MRPMIPSRVRIGFASAWLLSAGLTMALMPTQVPAQANTSRPILIERVVAVVNSEVIVETELQRRIAQARQAIARSGQQPPPPRVLREQVLDRMKRFGH